MLQNGVLILHDNKRLQIRAQIVELIKEYVWQQFRHWLIIVIAMQSQCGLDFFSQTRKKNTLDGLCFSILENFRQKVIGQIAMLRKNARLDRIRILVDK